MSTIHPDTTVNSHPDLQTSSFKEESSSLGLLRSLLAWLTLLSLGFFAGWWLGQSQATRHSQIALTDTALKSTNVSEGMVVTAEPIVQRTVARTVNAVGSLHAFEEVVVSSKVEGRVLRIAADVSTRVQPDAVLLELDSTDASLAVRQAERSLQEIGRAHV